MFKKITKFVNTKLNTSSEYIFSGGSWLVINNAISTAVILMLTIVLANIISPEIYGSYKYLMSLLVFVGTFILNDFKTVMPQIIAKGNLDFFTVATKIYFKWSFIGTILASVGAIYYYLQGNITLSTGMMLIAIFLPFYYTFNLYGTYPSGTANFKLLVKQNIVYVLLPAIAIISTAYYFENALFMFVAILISRTAVAAFFYYQTKQKIPKPKTTYPTEVKYGIQLSFISMFGKVTEALDNIIIFQFLGPIQLAIYSFALAIPNQLRTSQRILGTLALPRFSQRPLHLLRATMFKKLVIVYLFIIVVIFLYWISAPYIYSLLFPKYIEAVLYSQYLSLILLTVPTSMLQQALLTHMQKKGIYFMQITVPFVRIITLFTLVQMYALWGIVASFLIVGAYQALVLFIAFFTIKSVPK